ncbi:DE-cadherin [Aphelenchoides bicaudatus]|nr:DE-cadherin [Aphelenchoides bicaudatus]
MDSCFMIWQLDKSHCLRISCNLPFNFVASSQTYCQKTNSIVVDASGAVRAKIFEHNYRVPCVKNSTGIFKTRPSSFQCIEYPTAFLFYSSNSARSQLSPCHFPESSTQSFFFDVRADVPIGSVIVDSVVEPADAKLKILDGDFLSRFEIVQKQSGQFLLLTASDLHLPPFPSTINETTLYLTIECNQKAHPLISVRLRNYNSEAPQFLNEPYEMALVQETQVGSLLQTPVIAMDEDPAERYTITYELLNSQQNREFQLEMNSKPMEDLSTLPDSFNKRPYSRQQLPHQLQLRVLSPLRRKTYYLNVSASDNQEPPKQSTTTLKVLVGQQNEIMPHFTQQEYYANFSRSFELGTELVLNQPLMAIFPEPIGRRAQNGRQSPIHYQLMEGRFSQLFELQEQTGRLFLKQMPFGDPTEQLELEVKNNAFLDQEPDKFVKARLLLNDVSEVHLTYFAQCHYEVHLAENAAPNTKVAQFIVRGDIAGIDLLNGTEYFNVDTDGTVTVAKDANIDYEEVDRIIITARLRSSSALHPKSLELCQIATIDIHIDDINDYSPKFEQQAYTFYTDEYPYNNTEIGVVRAKDEDKGTFGKVHYRLLDPDAPFTLFEADGEATIYYVTKTEDYFPDRSYTVTIEAFDAKEYPRTARVNVRILLQPAPATTVESSTQTYSATPATVIKKSEKVAKPIRTHGAVNEERDRVEVSESKEDEKTLEEQQEFEAGPETFGDEEEIRTEDEVKKKQKMEGVVGHEETTTELTSTSRSSTQPSTTKKASVSREPPRFEQQNYNFSIDGHLEYGQYIGAIRLMQIEEDEDADEFKAGLEYTIEEGIKGFVKVDAEDGVLHVDNKLIEDSYEQIRFAAQARRGGQIINKFLQCKQRCNIQN